MLLMSRFTNEYGRRLNAARAAAGLSQQQLGDLVQRSRNSIRGIEAGHHSCSAEQVAQQAEALGVDPAWLLTGRRSNRAAPLAEDPGIVRRLPDFIGELRHLADRLDALAEGVGQ